MHDADGVNEKAEPAVAEPDNSSREASDIEKADVDLKEEVNSASPDPLRRFYTEEEENKVIRKLDWHLLPLIFVLYSLSVLDRSNLGNARISGMEDDINLEGTRYDW